MAVMREPQDRLLTLGQAACLLHVHDNTLRRWCDLGVIHSFRIGPRGDRRILSTDVDSLRERVALKQA